MLPRDPEPQLVRNGSRLLLGPISTVSGQPPPSVAMCAKADKHTTALRLDQNLDVQSPLKAKGQLPICTIGGGDRRCEVRSRATSSEWACYYERADRVRRRFGDPFQRLITRGARRERRLRFLVTLLALGAGATLVFLAIQFIDTASFRSVFDEISAPQASVSEDGPT
jgi:hypothetical protein